MKIQHYPPRILILSFHNFTGIAHIPKCLKEAGFEVAALCPAGGHLAQTRFLDELYHLPRYFFYWTIRQKFLEVAAEWKPDLLMPGDDTACAFLQNLRLQMPDGEHPRISALIEHSLGTPAHYRSCSDKAMFGNLCARLGLRFPEQYRSGNTQEVIANGARLGSPVVIKKSLSCGGVGVEICGNEDELRTHATGFFGSGPMPLVKRLWWEVHMAKGGDVRHLMRPQEDTIVVQEFIGGRVCSHTFVAWQGEYLSGFTYENLNSAEASKNPCRKLRVLDVRNDCEEVARKLAGELQLTGFACVDFIRDASGELFVLECNARPTHTVILGEKVGLNLARLLFERTARDTAYVRESVFSLFPDGMKDDPSGFDAANSVIPWDDPALLASFLRDQHPLAVSKKWLAGLPLSWLWEKWLGYRNRRLVFQDPAMFEVPEQERVTSAAGVALQA